MQEKPYIRMNRREQMMNTEKMWIYFIYLGTNMSGKPNKHINFCMEEEWEYRTTLYTDRGTWNKITAELPKRGFNTLLIDMSEGVKLDSHPELAIPGSWEKADFIQELDRLRKLGLNPLPKYNFSCMHNAWLQDYANMGGTKRYNEVCADIIRETIEMFGTPEYFHLGMEEEKIENQSHYPVMRERTWKRRTEDLLFLCDVCREKGVRPWIWVDVQSIEALGGAEKFRQNVPKDVLISNWWYSKIHYDGDTEHPRTKLYRDIDSWGYEQVPTGSTYSYAYNLRQTMRYCKEYLKDENIKGFMTAAWQSTLPHYENGLLYDAEMFGQAKALVYPNE
jgi:hypothetical protein